MGDLRYGARKLPRNPGFSALAILILTLGTGAATAVFSMVNFRDGAAERVRSDLVTENYFAVFGVQPVAGRFAWPEWSARGVRWRRSLALPRYTRARAAPSMYPPALQNYSGRTVAMVRTRGNSAQALAGLARIVAAVDPDLALFGQETNGASCRGFLVAAAHRDGMDWGIRLPRSRS